MPLNVKVMLGLLKRAPWPSMVCVALIIGALAYLIFGWSWSQRAAAVGAESQVTRFLEAHAEQNPELAHELTKLRRTYGDAAVATKLKLDERAAREALDIKTLQDQLQTGEPLYEIELTRLALGIDLQQEEDTLENFLVDYDMHLRMVPDQAEIREVLDALHDATESPADWRFVWRGFGELLVWKATREQPVLWSLYTREFDWLSDLIGARLMLEIDLESIYESDFSVDDILRRIRELLMVAEAYGDLLEVLYNKAPEQAMLAYHVIEVYGDALTITTSRYGVPLDEAVAVLFANPGVLETLVQEVGKGKDPAELQASFLNEVRSRHPNVWTHAAVTVMALQLFHDAPVHAEEVLTRFGSNPSFIDQLYETYGPDTVNGNAKLLRVVAAALAKYGDVAAYVLYEKRNNQAFRTALVDPDIGIRIVPYAARFPDKLGQVLEDPGWIDKYFEEDGRLRDAERWWEALPGGSLAKVASNWVNGYPCDWSEMGWAVFEVVDVGLMFATVGTSKVMTSSAKTTVKVGVRVGARTADAAEKTLSLIRRGAHTAGGAGDFSKSTNLLAKASRGVAESAEVTANRVKWLDLDAMVKRGDEFSENISKLSQTKNMKIWKRAGYILAAGKLYARKAALAKAPEQIAQTGTDLAVETAKVPGRILAETVRQIAQEMGAGINRLFVPVVHLGIVAVLLLAAGAVRRISGPQAVEQL